MKLALGRGERFINPPSEEPGHYQSPRIERQPCDFSSDVNRQTPLRAPQNSTFHALGPIEVVAYAIFAPKPVQCDSTNTAFASSLMCGSIACWIW
jgi:hypothetical protein